MQDIWIESFYNEIDAEKRQAFLKRTYRRSKGRIGRISREALDCPVWQTKTKE